MNDGKGNGDRCPVGGVSVPGGVRLRVLVLLLLFRGRGILRGGSGVLRYRLRLRGAGNNRHLSNGGEQGYIQVTINGTTYTGFSSGAYLKKQ